MNIWKSDIADNKIGNLIQTVAVSVLKYGSIICVVWNKPLKHYLTKQLFIHLHPISQIIHVRLTRHTRHCC